MFRQALIVDDLPDSVGSLCEVVMSAYPGVSCACAGDIASARIQMGLLTPNIALVDLELPDGPGSLIIAELVRRHPDCIVVVATIFDDDEHLFPALQAGAQGYLLKDQPRDMLVRQLRGIAEGQPPLAPAVARRLLGYFQTHPGKPASPESQLSPREREVLALLARAVRITEIAERLGISRHTVGDHVKNIYRKLNISSRAEAALHARDIGLLP